MPLLASCNGSDAPKQPDVSQATFDTQSAELATTKGALAKAEAEKAELVTARDENAAALAKLQADLDQAKANGTISAATAARLQGELDAAIADGALSAADVKRLTGELAEAKRQLAALQPEVCQ